MVYIYIYIKKLIIKTYRWVHRIKNLSTILPQNIKPLASQQLVVFIEQTHLAPNEYDWKSWCYYAPPWVHKIQAFHNTPPESKKWSLPFMMTSCEDKAGQ